MYNVYTLVSAMKRYHSIPFRSIFHSMFKYILPDLHNTLTLKCFSRTFLCAPQVALLWECTRSLLNSTRLGRYPSSMSRPLTWTNMSASRLTTQRVTTHTCGRTSSVISTLTQSTCTFWMEMRPTLSKSVPHLRRKLRRAEELISSSEVYIVTA